MRVLLLEDFPPVVRALKIGLEEEGFVIDVAPDRGTGARQVWENDYDLIILDLKAPEEDGLALLRDWRHGGLTTHVLTLTAPGRVQETVRSLDAGADDCLTKPFAFEELLARLRALGRRAAVRPPDRVRCGDLEIDPDAHMVRRGGRTIRLTPREFALLALLARHRGQVVTRSMIRESLYDDIESTSNVVDVYIRYLRNKIDKGFAVPLILTRWGEGYLLRAEEPVGSEVDLARSGHAS
jgi:DNA-binding response OmpR family regulator